MLLHRLIEHVKAQHWTAVVLDLAVVIVGVLIAFQVDRWGEAARERAEERQYLERLLADVDRSIADTTNGLDFLRTHTAREGLVLDSLRACTLADDQRDEFASGLYQLGKLIPTRFILGTMDEMRSSGRLRVIRNSDIRDALNSVASAHDYEVGLFPVFAGLNATHLAYIEDHVVFLLDEEIPGGGDITWDEISIDFDALCRDQTFLGAVSGARRLDYVNINLSERALALMRDARTALRTELGTTEHAGGVPAGGVPAGGEPAGGG